MLCRLCGAPVPKTGRRGRPAAYCGPRCRRLAHNRNHARASFLRHTGRVLALLVRRGRMTPDLARERWNAAVTRAGRPGQPMPAVLADAIAASSTADTVSSGATA